MGRKPGTGTFSRTRASGVVVHYIDFVDQHGKRHQELSGTNKVEAQRLHARRKREVALGTYSPEFKSGTVTLRVYGTSWGEKRKNKTADDDRARLRDHVFPILGELPLAEVADNPGLIKHLVDKLREKGTIADKTIGNVVASLSVMFRDAKFERLVTSNPCTDLPKGILPRPGRKRKDIYEPGPLVTLLTSTEVPLDRRVFYALLSLSGQRHGEAAGRRWHDLDWHPKPLASLYVHSQYYDEPLKSPDGEPRPRMVPIHPELARILREWQLSGFAEYFGRPPKPDDFIVPSRRGPQFCRTVRRSLTNLVEKDCPKAGVEARTVHRFRDTFISLCRRGDAPKDKVEMVTHNARGEIIDAYTNIDWEPLCRTVLCLKLVVRPAVVASLPIAVGADPLRDVLRDAPAQKTESSHFWLPSERGGRDSKPYPPPAEVRNPRENFATRANGSPSNPGAIPSASSTSDARHAIDREAEDFQAAVAEHAELVELAEEIRRG